MVREDIVHPLCLPQPHQPRASMERLASWWQTTGSGLVVVSGIAGCGKTAFAAHFLALLRWVYGSDTGRLPQAPDLFVFSFRELPDPAACLTRLHALLPKVEHRTPAAEDARKKDEEAARRPDHSMLEYFSALLDHPVSEVGHRSPDAETPEQEDQQPSEEPPDDSLIGRIRASSGRLLIIFDGLDAVQIPSADGEPATWEIEDPLLRELVAEVASGSAANVVLLITTRFALGRSTGGSQGHDRSSTAEGSFLAIELDRFEVQESVLFLRQHDLDFSDAALHQAAAAAAHHPLVLAAISREGATERLGLPSFESLIFQPPSHPAPSSLELPSSREELEHLADQYFELLARDLPDAHALADHLTTFERPVSTSILRASSAVSMLSEGSRLDVALRALSSMRLLVEFTTPKESVTIHPILRFASVRAKPDPDRRRALSEILLHLLVETPHGEPPSDPHRLDLLEEILRQALAGGDLAGASRVYTHQLGGFSHLGRYLGDYERGERICRVLLDQAVRLGLADSADSLPYDWLLYLVALGRLADAEIAYRLLKVAPARPDPQPARLLQFHALLLLLQGRLIEALVEVNEVLALFTRAHEPPSTEALVLRGHLLTLLGQTPKAAADFTAAAASSRWIGIEYMHLLMRVTPLPEHRAQRRSEDDQLREAREALNELRQLLDQRWGPLSPDCMRAHLLAAELDLGDAPALPTSLDRVTDWARARGAQELACWALLAQGRSKLRLLRGEPFEAEALQTAIDTVTEGVNIARTCGYGIYYIDLLVTRSRLLLLARGAAAAEADARSALRERVDENTKLGLLEILPASDPRSGYRWGEAAARQALAEALLLKADQIWGQTPSASRLPEDLARDFLKALQDARSELEACKRLRQQLGDPHLRDTERILDDLSHGLLKEPVLSSIGRRQQLDAQLSAEPPVPPAPQVFVSYNSKDRDAAQELVTSLRAKGVRPWFDQDELLGGDAWMRRLEDAIESVDAAIVTVGPSGVGPWQQDEVSACLMDMKARGKRVIPLLLPNARNEPRLPLFLRNYNYFNMINGITEANLDKLVASIRTPLL